MKRSKTTFGLLSVALVLVLPGIVRAEMFERSDQVNASGIAGQQSTALAAAKRVSAQKKARKCALKGKKKPSKAREKAGKYTKKKPAKGKKCPSKTSKKKSKKGKKNHTGKQGQIKDRSKAVVPGMNPARPLVSTFTSGSSYTPVVEMPALATSRALENGFIALGTESPALHSRTLFPKSKLSNPEDQTFFDALCGFIINNDEDLDKQSPYSGLIRHASGKVAYLNSLLEETRSKDSKLLACIEVLKILCSEVQKQVSRLLKFEEAWAQAAGWEGLSPEQQTALHKATLALEDNLLTTFITWLEARDGAAVKGDVALTRLAELVNWSIGYFDIAQPQRGCEEAEWETPVDVVKMLLAAVKIKVKREGVLDDLYAEMAGAAVKEFAKVEAQGDEIFSRMSPDELRGYIDECTKEASAVFTELTPVLETALEMFLRQIAGIRSDIRGPEELYQKINAKLLQEKRSILDPLEQSQGAAYDVGEFFLDLERLDNLLRPIFEEVHQETVKTLRVVLDECPDDNTKKSCVALGKAQQLIQSGERSLRQCTNEEYSDLCIAVNEAAEALTETMEKIKVVREERKRGKTGSPEQEAAILEESYELLKKALDLSTAIGGRHIFSGWHWRKTAIINHKQGADIYQAIASTVKVQSTDESLPSHRLIALAKMAGFARQGAKYAAAQVRKEFEGLAGTGRLTAVEAAAEVRINPIFNMMASRLLLFVEAALKRAGFEPESHIDLRNRNQICQKLRDMISAQQLKAPVDVLQAYAGFYASYVAANAEGPACLMEATLRAWHAGHCGGASSHPFTDVIQQ